MAPSFSSILGACNPNPEKAGKILLVLNVLGMVFAAISNTYGAAKDKNTSKEDKKFLVPAGATTGVANIGLYYGMTVGIIKKLEKNAKKALSEMSDREITQSTLEYVNANIAKAQKGFLGTGLFKKSEEEIASMTKTLLQNANNPTEYAKDLFKKNTVAGFGVLGAFIGAVIGCSVITPIIRDVSAYIVQKRMEKQDPDLQNKPYRPYFDPIHLRKNGVVMNKNLPPKNQPLSMKSYMAFTSGNMKV